MDIIHVLIEECNQSCEFTKATYIVFTLFKTKIFYNNKDVSDMTILGISIKNILPKNIKTKHTKQIMALNMNTLITNPIWSYVFSISKKNNYINERIKNQYPINNKYIILNNNIIYTFTNDFNLIKNMFIYDNIYSLWYHYYTPFHREGISSLSYFFKYDMTKCENELLYLKENIIDTQHIYFLINIFNKKSSYLFDLTQKKPHGVL